MRHTATIAPLLIALCLAGMGVSTSWAVEESTSVAAPKAAKKAKPAGVQTKDREIPRAVIVQSESGRVMRLEQDSIYAREISIDNSGIRIVDREGLEIILPPHPIGPGGHPHTPDMPDIVFHEEGGGDQVTQMASDIEVRADEVVRGDVVCIFCDIDVAGTVTGSAVSVFGNVNIEGKVGNEAVAPFGRIRVGPDGHVRSDAVASKIVREPGGRIDGNRREMFFNFFGGEEGFGEAWTRTTFTVVVALKILFWLFLVLLAHALAARNITKVKDRIQRSYAKSFMMGILGQILLIPVFLLLLITIIGIPVALFVLPLMLFGGLVLAQAAVGQIVGDKIAENTSLPLRTPLSRTVAGVAALQIFAYLTIVFIWPAGHGSSGGAFRLITLIMFVLSVVMGYVVITLGTGAVILTRWGTRPKEVLASPGTLPSTDIPMPPDSAVTPLPFEPRESPDPGAAPLTS